MCVEVVYFDFQFVSNANYTRVPRGANRTIACLIIIIITPMSHCGGCRSDVVSWLWLSLSALDQKLHILDEQFFTSSSLWLTRKFGELRWLNCVAMMKITVSVAVVEIPEINCTLIVRS